MEVATGEATEDGTGDETLGMMMGTAGVVAAGAVLGNLLYYICVCSN